MNSGIVTLRLIQAWSEWVFRRIDYITVDDVVTVHVRASLDFALPADAHPTSRMQDGTRIVFVPLAFLDKQRMTRFSLRDEGNKALSILIQPKVARIGAATLWTQAQLARVAAPHLAVPEEMPEQVQQALLEIAGQRRADALDALDRLMTGPLPGNGECKKWMRLLRHSPRFQILAGKLAEAYLLITPMPQEDAQRGRILKLSYETTRATGDDRPDPIVRRPRAWLGELARHLSLQPYVVGVGTGVVGRSQCYHQEFEAPEGLQITGASLSVYAKDEHANGSALLCPPDVVFGKLQRAHLHVAGVGIDAWGYTELRLRVRISNIARTAWMASGVTVALLVAVALLAAFLPGSVTSVVALLLVPPAALSAYVARPAEPLVSTVVVFGLRMIAAVSALCAFIAAGVAAIGKECVSEIRQVSPSVERTVTNCDTRNGALVAIMVLVTLSVVIFALLELVRRRVNSPPEHVDFRDLQQSRDEIAQHLANRPAR